MLSLLYSISLFTLAMLMWLSIYKYHSLSFHVGLGFNYELWEMSWMFEHFGAWWDNLFRMVRGTSFFFFNLLKKNVCLLSLVIHERWSVAEVNWWDTDLPHSSTRQIDSLGPVSTSPERHTCSQMFRGLRGHMWPPGRRSQHGAHSSKSAEEQWGFVSWLAAISSRFLSVHLRGCAC